MEGTTSGATQSTSAPLLSTNAGDTENLSNTPIKLSVFKESSRKELEALLTKIEGPKAFVLDSKLSGPLGLVADAKVLKDKGVEKIFYLDTNRLPCELVNIVYLVLPQVENMKCIANQITDHKRMKQKKNYHILFVPRTTLICDRWLEELGIYNDVTISQFQLDLLVLDDDVISLELEQSFHECFLENNKTSLYYVARALMKIQSTYGLIENIKVKGNAAKQVLDMILRMRNEMDSEAVVVPEIDTLILIDRQVDAITPMMTQLTYEGQIDEVYAIKYGMTILDPEILGKDKADKKQKYSLSSNDRLFSDIRNLNITRVGPFLNQRAGELEAFKLKLKDQKTVGEIKDYAKYLPIYQKDFQSLCVHLKIVDRILDCINTTEFREQLDAEQGLVADDIEAFEYIEELINRQEPIHRVLRILVLQSLITNGLKPKALEFFRNEILQTYGNEYLYTLINLEKLGWLSKQEQKPTFPLIRNKLRLIADVPVERSPTDISYVFSGYAPITGRIIEAASKPNGWKSIDDVMKLIPGTTLEVTQEIPAGVKQLSEDMVQDRNKITLVFFIGGITFAEIAAIRFLHKKDDGKRDFIIATTKLISGNTIFDNVIEPVGNCLHTWTSPMSASTPNLSANNNSNS